jgi:hypothetical protein
MNLRRWRIQPKFIVGFALLVSLLGNCSSVQAQQKPEQLARQSADAWLALVDAGKYDESWEEAAQLFKAAVTKKIGERRCVQAATRSATFFPASSRALLTRLLSQALRMENTSSSNTTAALSTNRQLWRR